MPGIDLAWEARAVSGIKGIYTSSHSEAGVSPVIAALCFWNIPHSGYSSVPCMFIWKSIPLCLVGVASQSEGHEMWFSVPSLGVSKGGQMVSLPLSRHNWAMQEKCLFGCSQKFGVMSYCIRFDSVANQYVEQSLSPLVQVVTHWIHKYVVIITATRPYYVFQNGNFYFSF